MPSLSVADLGEGHALSPPPSPSPLILGKKEEMTEGRKASRASKSKPIDFGITRAITPWTDYTALGPVTITNWTSLSPTV